MFEVGALVVYGSDGVCRVEKVGPLEMQGAQKGVDYYTLSPLYRGGTIFIPVDAQVRMRPVMTREEAEDLIAHISEIQGEKCQSHNPRLLHERYQTSLKSGSCVELVKLIRTIYAKGREAADKGRHLGQVDERSKKQAMDMLHGELAVALDIPLDEVEDYISRTIQRAQESDGTEKTQD